MILVGNIWMLIRYEIIKIPFLKPGSDSYRLSAVGDKKK